MKAPHDFKDPTLKSHSKILKSPDEKEASAKKKDSKVQLFVKIKTHPKSERSPKNILSNNSIKIINDNQIKIPSLNPEINSDFTFDRVFVIQNDLKEIFQTTTIPLLKHALTGFSSAIFVYGQPGTGNYLK